MRLQSQGQNSQSAVDLFAGDGRADAGARKPNQGQGQSEAKQSQLSERLRMRVALFYSIAGPPMRQRQASKNEFKASRANLDKRYVA